MRADIIQRLAIGAKSAILANPMFPYRSGNLKKSVFEHTFSKNNFEGFSIVFDVLKAPYIPYLEYGVRPQYYWRRSPKKANLSGVYTRGSSKHVGFISERATNDIITYLAQQLRQPVAYKVINNEGREY